MVHLHVERTIAAPREQVFEWLADPASLAAAPLVVTSGWAPGSARGGLGAVRRVICPGLWFREEITAYEQPGELLVKSPSVVQGYLNNDKANAETFQDGYMRTGDEGVVRKAPSGHEHIFIVDRIKELIKVKVRFAKQAFKMSEANK